MKKQINNHDINVRFKLGFSARGRPKLIYRKFFIALKGIKRLVSTIRSAFNILQKENRRTILSLRRYILRGYIKNET